MNDFDLALTTTDIKQQHLFAKNKNDRIRLYLAGNPSLTIDIQRVLANDNDADVRCKLAGNQSLHIDIQHVLVKNDDKWVRCYLAINTSIADEIQFMLAKDGFSIWMISPGPKTEKYLKMLKVLDQ